MDNMYEKTPPVEKTFVEGRSAVLSTDPGPEQTLHHTPDQLPSGDRPVPLGSGTVAGVLGTGGMARIYKVWNEQLEIFRAVKILLPTQRPELRERFETEARITAKLDHPNIVDVLTVGEWQGLPYLEMEYVDGYSLADLVDERGRLPDPVCSAIAILVARALVHAHHLDYVLYGKPYHGIIHRDLKPANVMISRDGAVKLMDFGIARPLGTSLHTVEGNVVGTLQYLSPEQMDGEEIDCRTDIYSFGAILYEMLTGTRTFPQETLTNLMKVRALNQYRTFGELGLRVPAFLARISDRCLQADRDKRYPDAEALLDELESAHQKLSAVGADETLRAYFALPESFGVNSARPRQAVPGWMWPATAGGLAAIAAASWILLAPPDANEPSRTPPTQPATPRPQEQPVAATPPAPLPPPGPAPSNTQPAPAPHRRPVTDQPARRATALPSEPVTVAAPLAVKYGTRDMLEVATRALGSGAAEDALAALGEVGETEANRDARTMLFLEALMRVGRTSEASNVAAGRRVDDAWFDLLSGRLAQQQGEPRRALDLYQASLTRPSALRSRTEIRSDALYHTATVYDDIYRQSPTPDTRLQAINAWNNLKRCYMATPEHPRFKAANNRLAQID